MLRPIDAQNPLFSSEGEALAHREWVLLLALAAVLAEAAGLAAVLVVAVGLVGVAVY